MENRPPFTSLPNFRDVGSFINARTPKPVLKTGLLFRSARPDATSPQELARLKSEYHITTQIDLRTKTEHLEQLDKLSKSSPSKAPATRPKDPGLALAVQGLRYENVNLNGSSYSNSLLKELSYLHVAKLAALYAVGHRTSAISILGTNVMAPSGLTGLAERTLQTSTAEIGQLFRILADEKAWPVMIHCTQGKDRTGLSVLLILMLCGVAEEAIDADYMATQAELVNERAARVKEIESIGLPESFADCEPGWVRRVMSFINDEKGGIEAYLTSCGVSKAEMEAVRGFLLQR
ncbi:hypothetical protein B0A48_07203 [Cryoendolithus antarcticus]|uniref:Tyrosine specific protein phosphatases domain-containing protein n=1 Tax=Cryoendolithus antarcticus TaxID=1507870 RepID=A0A1V8T7W1_9PEZI|nr:hypothetical protein B0A48_07203 [Cryoendolithus antarcticus]